METANFHISLTLHSLADVLLYFIVRQFAIIACRDFIDYKDCAQSCLQTRKYFGINREPFLVERLTCVYFGSVGV